MVRHSSDDILSLRKSSAGRILAFCWIAALALHVVWVPNIIWFMIAPQKREQSEVVEITTITMAPRPTAPPNKGLSEVGRYRSEIELPGTAPGGSTRAVAPMRHEWPRDSARQAQSYAPRARDWAVDAVFYRPAQSRHHRTPADRISTSRPAEDDTHLNGLPSRDDSLLRRRGESRTGERQTKLGGGGTPSSGLRVPLGNGEESAASAGSGQGQHRRAARRGARPRIARPAVLKAPLSSAAPQEGPLGGMQPSRQATPEVAVTNVPVREARIASRDSTRASKRNAGRLSRRNHQGAASEARGPGRGGLGRGTSGDGRASSSLLSDYRRDVISRVASHWSYPEELAYDMRQGLVVLQLRIRHDGRIERVTVRRSSGYAMFDEYAVKAVHQANPLAPPPPEELFRNGGDSLDLPLPMRYRNPMFE